MEGDLEPEEIVPQANIIAPNVMVEEVFMKQLVVEGGLYEDNPLTCMRWLATRGHLINLRECDLCPGNVQCRFMRAAHRTDLHEWRCPNFQACSFKASIRRDSFFSKSKLTLQQILEIIYHWANEYKQSEMMRETRIGPHAAGEWFNFIRDIYGLWVTDHRGPIGGVDPAGNPIEVQIDESKFMHRKYNRGVFREGHWVFEGIEVGVPGAPNCFLVVYPGNRRDAATLLLLVQQWVLPGSRVVSGM